MHIQFITIETKHYDLDTDADKTFERHYRPEHIIHACADFQNIEEEDSPAKMYITYKMKYATGDDNMPYYTRHIPDAQASVMCAILKDYASPHSFLDFFNYVIPDDVFEREFGL